MITPNIFGLNFSYLTKHIYISIIDCQHGLPLTENVIA